MNFFLRNANNIRQTLFLVFSFVFFFAFGAGIAAEDLIHVVGRGETIYSISRFYSVPSDDLMRTNNISDPSRLQVGARLKIPVTDSALPAQGLTQSLIDYRVARGDTLYRIAQSNGTTLANLLEINSFTPNHVIRIGDVIKVPASNSNSNSNVNVTANVTANNTTDNTSAENQQPVTSASVEAASGIYSLRWPITPKDISYMTGQMGVVVEGEQSESVRSLTQGNVISAGPWRKFGRVVIIETQEGYFYMYGGCDILSVSVGDKVSPGTEVGRLGLNTVSEKPQLFFMVFRGETPIDPANAPRTNLGRT